MVKCMIWSFATKAWLATYFDLPHLHLYNPKGIRNRNHMQLAFLMVPTRNRNCNFISNL
jgi:hypothetical protein